MGKEEQKHEWSLAKFGAVTLIIGTLLGGVIGVGGSWYIWHLQQDVANEQKLLEKQNIANAIYIDVSNIETILNDSIENTNYTINDQNNPNHASAYLEPYYNNNWLYPFFGRDIAGFDSNTSADLYDFYNYIVDIENRRQFVLAVMEKQARDENLTQYEVARAHQYSNSIYMLMIPDCISLAEKIKRELRLKYNVKEESSIQIVHNPYPQAVEIQGLNLTFP
jgi:hypothetical protein